MVTEDMIERAMAGEKVFFRDTQGRCMLIWRTGRTLRFVPQLEEQCKK